VPSEFEGTPDEAPPAFDPTPPDPVPPDSVVEAEVPPPPPDPVAVLTKERDDYLDALRRLQAEFENYKKRMVRQQTDHLERAGEALVTKLLPVLDAVDLARDHGAGDDLEQVAGALLDVLGKEGLERIDPVGQLFDPNEHDAVQHEQGDHEHPVVSGLMRAGWRWKGRVLRPAMVVVKG
jgi:molecular chaperone GrpE